MMNGTTVVTSIGSLLFIIGHIEASILCDRRSLAVFDFADFI